MALTPREIVERITDAVRDGGTQWILSAHAYPDFPEAKDSGDVLHQSFAVGATRTITPSTDRQTRGRTPHIGAWSVTELSARFFADVRPHDKQASYLEALDLEADLIKRISAVARPPELQLRFVGADTREFVDETTYYGEVQFEVTHHYPLE